jgi:type VI protein secretion system component VasF
MADEQYVNRNQHRADMAELRGELKEEIAGLRHDVVMLRGELKEEIAGVRQEGAVLAKTMEHLGQTMAAGFADIRQAIGDLGRRLEQTRDELGTRLEQTRDELATRLERQEITLRQEIREVRTTNQRQLWVLIAVVIVTMVGGMIKVTFFP